MHRFSLLCLTSASLLLSFPAFSAEPGTYRPGKVYSSVPASHAQLCESQCQGDAQCRTWNFVKVNDRQASGVCELNLNAPNPISSPVSISGLNQSGPVLSSSKIISGGTNTIRIGQGSALQSPPRVTAATNQQVRPKVQQPQRRIVREPIPQRINARQSAYRPHPQSLTQQQNIQRQSRPNPLQTRPQFSAPPPHRQAPRQAPQQAPQFKHNLDVNPQNLARTNTAPRQTSPFARQPQTGPRSSNANPENQPLARQSVAAADPRLLELQRRRNAQIANAPSPARAQSPFAAPNQAQRQQAPIQQAQRQPVQRPQVRPQAFRPPQPQLPQAMVKLPAERAQESLFGSLYDDVIVPAPINPETFSKNSDAPLATVKAVPTIPVTTENLEGLAGPVPR